MRKLLKSLLVAGAVLVATLSLAAPASATTVTLYSVSTYGWSSGWHHAYFGAPYESYTVTATYSGSFSGCGSNSDYFRVVASNQWEGGDLHLGEVASYGGAWGTSSTQSFYVSTSTTAGYDEFETQNLWWYVGPQSACHLTVRVWDQA